MKKKILSLLLLAPWLANAFPVNTNRFFGKASESTPPGFDAVAWNWSGFDDQLMVFEFSDVVFSNAGVRLSYPVRGATYLDFASANGQGVVATTNITTIVLETFTNCYGRVPAGTNFYAGATNGTIATSIYDPPLQYGDVVDVSGLTTIAASNGVASTSIPPACIVYVASNYSTFVPDYGVTTNTWIGSTSVVTRTYVYNVKNQVVKDPTFGSTQQWTYSGFTYQLLYPSNGAQAAQGRFTANGGGSDSVKSLSQQTLNIYTSQYQVSITYYIKQNVYTPSVVETNTLSVTFGGFTSNRVHTFSSADPIPSWNTWTFYMNPTSFVPAMAINYSGNTNAGIGIDKVTITPTAYSFVSNGVTTVTTNIIAGSNQVKTLSAGYVRNNGGYSSNTVTYYQYRVNVPRTNIPPDGMYYTEVLAYDTTTNQTRSLLKGQITVSHSLYANTNLATWVSPSLGRFTFLNSIEGGAQILGGAGITVDTTGTNITVTATGEAQSTDTNALPLSGGRMRGNINFTNAGLTSLDFADFDLAPTSEVTAGRLQWNSSRSTLKLGMNALDLDVGQQLFLFAKSQETNTISKGEVVFVAGALGDNPTIKRASSISEGLSARTIGIAAENIAINNNGFVVTRGTIYNIDTSAFTQGALLYLGVGGTMQTNIPVAPTNAVFIGVVERVGVNNGQIYVAVQNYQELAELSDVYVSSPSNDYVLTYVATNSRWEARAASGGGGVGSITNIKVASGSLYVTNGAGPEVSIGISNTLRVADLVATNTADILGLAFASGGYPNMLVQYLGDDVFDFMPLQYSQLVGQWLAADVVYTNNAAIVNLSKLNSSISSSTKLDWGTRFEGSVNGGWTRSFGSGLDDISTDSATNMDSYAAFLYTASTAAITNTLYGEFTIPYRSASYPLKVRANQGSGTVIFTATDGATASVSTQTIAAANTTYITNVVMPATSVTNVKVQVIMSTTNAANLYRIGIGR